MNKLLVSAFSLVLLSACSSDGDEVATINYDTLACSSATGDSSFNGALTTMRSHTFPNTYKSISVRATTIDYMVHDNANPKALVMLIAGGQLDASITGLNDGSAATSSSGNFLVRSAHLFAAQGFKVITIDRPGDWATFKDPSHPNQNSGSAFDPYRLSTEHMSDLQAIIAAENVTSLPVVIAGTSRGAISAVAQHSVAQYVLLSAPVTSGGRGSPLGSSGVQPNMVGNKPVHMIWHQNDDCFVSTPAGANVAAGNFSNITATQVTGGIDHPELSSRTSNEGCDGSKTYHGFLGIESCVVKNATDWLNTKL